VDVSSPASPTRLGSFAPTGIAADVQVAGNLAFVANRGIWNGSIYVGGELQIVNVGTPAAPKLVNSYPVEYAASVAVAGGRAYLAASDGLHILNVSDPAHLAVLSKFSASSIRVFWKVRVVGSRAYAVADIDADTGLVVIDLSNLAAPKLLGSYISPTGRSTDVQVVGDRAYLTDRYGSLRVLNVHDPAHIVELGSYGNNYGSFSAVHVVGTLAFVAEAEDNSGDLEIVDVSNPAKLKLLGERHLPSQALGVQVVGNLVYLSLDQGGLHVFRFPARAPVFLPIVRR
jgi:hypothetical protein